MKTGRLALWAALGMVSCVAGCRRKRKWDSTRTVKPIGSGGSTGGPVTADFQFDPGQRIHADLLSMPYRSRRTGGLQLDAAHSYNLLVGVPSAEEPSLLRVKPAIPPTAT